MIENFARAPALVGDGKVGATLAVEIPPGREDVGIALRWRRDGVDILGATGVRYVPGPEDDLAEISCLVIASGPEGVTEALAGPLRITHVAPRAACALFEEILDQESGVWTVAAGEDFTGAALRFSVSGAGAAIDPATGLVSLPTVTARAGETVTVTARNSGGVAVSRFLVTVEAAEPESLVLAAGEAAPEALSRAIDWRLLRYRTRAEVETGVYYGDPEQFQQCVARSASHPDRIYLGQDVGPIRRSDDGGATWRVCVARGLRNAYFLGGAVDPVNPDIFMVQCHNRVSVRAQAQAGIWRTTDGGVTFARVQPTGPVGEPRIVADTMVYAPGSIDDRGARRWYCAFAGRPLRDDTPADSGVWMSDDHGVSWVRRARALPPALFGDDVFRVAVSPADPALIWMGTSLGLFRSRDAGVRWDRVGPGAALPEGACTHIEIDPARGDRIFVSIDGQGGYYTEDAFAGAATELFAWSKLRRAFPHPANWDICVRLPRRGSSFGIFDQAEVSTNTLARLGYAGAESDWTRCEVPEKPGSSAGWWREITGEPSAVRWHPTNLASAFASARGHLFRTSDRINWVFSNEGASGFCYGNATVSTEFMFDHFDPARIFMPHADMGILATTDRFETYASVAGYADLALRTNSTRTTSNVCALRPVPGSTEIVAAIGDYNASTLVYSPDAGASWRAVGPSVGPEATTIRCWSINYALSEPAYCYVNDHRSADGGASWTRMETLRVLGTTMMVLGVSRAAAGPGGPTIYAADHRGKAPYANLWKSTDRGESWSLVLTYRRGSLRGGPESGFDAPIFRVDPRDPHVVFVAAPTGAGGGVPGSVSRYDTRTGGWRHCDIWQALDRSDGNGVSRLAIDWHHAARAPEAPLILYAQLMHPGMRNILRSLDEGATWENMTYDSTNAVGQGFEVSPVTGELFSGGEAGTRMLAPPYATEGTVGAGPGARPNNIALTP